MEQQNTRAISHERAPCVWHATHSPVTIINELHHVVPQAWQDKRYGKVILGPVPVCGTGHNSFHEALRRVCNHGEPIPRWCVGKMRDDVEAALAWRAANLPDVKAP